MGMESRPNSDYTRTWSPPGEIEYAKLADGTRLRYVKAGSGPALILLHTVRTQLDHFQLVIPKLVHAFRVFAIDMPGMGWSDITPGASYAEPALRLRPSSSSRRWISTMSRWQASRWVRRCR
jgi:pimeloyl-ACP methyl ester carboxylesterase